jgi:hypothetical protein
MMKRKSEIEDYLLMQSQLEAWVKSPNSRDKSWKGSALRLCMGIGVRDCFLPYQEVGRSHHTCVDCAVEEAASLNGKWLVIL